MTPALRLRVRCAGRPLWIDGVATGLLTELRDAILSRATGTSSSPSLNEGGWKSDDKLLSWELPCARRLREALLAHTGGGDPVGWAMVNRRGSRHRRHRHDGSVVSGVYYVDAGDDAASCPTVFELADGRQIAVEPDPGRLVLFPGDMEHWVPEYRGDRPRVTVAFDLRR
jgi:hypothetical protein